MAVQLERLGQGPTVVLVHGFTQTGRSWATVAEDLARDHEVVLLDAPGHGASAEVAVGLAEGAGPLADAVGTGPATWVGYSMGARWCLHVALSRPAAVGALAMLGGTAGIEDARERAERRARDQATAARLAEVGVERFVEEWLAQPLFADLPSDRAVLADRLRNTVAGLRSSLELAGTGAQTPLWDRLVELAMPVLCIAGERDDRYRRLAERMAAAIGPHAESGVVPAAGHAAHLERPEAFLAVLRPWLARVRR